MTFERSDDTWKVGRSLPDLALVDVEQKKLIIDGVEFPWYFGNDWTVTTNGVNLTIFAKVVEVRR